MNMKKLVSLVLALVMVMAMMVPAMAADITINGSGNAFAGWMLLNATNAENDTTKFAYTVNEKYLTVLQEITGKDTDAEIVAYIASLKGDAGAVRNFADEVYAQVKAMPADATASEKKFTDVPQGYWLIAETEAAENDTYSLVMLDTAGVDSITVNTKENTPTVEKKVKEGDTWQDAADYDIGDDVEFQLTGTVTSKYDEYETYYFAFHDELSAGLSFNNDVKVYVDGNEITAGFEVVTDPADDCSFEVVFEDLKTIEAVKASSEIVVTYTAKLTGDAVVIGKPGNTNTVVLEFSNNPYEEDDGTPDTGETPEDKVTVFTYELNVDKVDGNEQPLEGAGFTLYKQVEDAWVAVGAEVTGVVKFEFEGLDAGTYKLVETTVPAGYNKAADVIFVIVAEYETDSDDPKLTALKVQDEEGNEMDSFTVTPDSGLVETAIKNLSGTELPETGGMGTTMIYIAGGLLVAFAAVMLITKRRMNAAE